MVAPVSQVRHHPTRLKGLLESINFIVQLDANAADVFKKLKNENLIL